MTTAFILMAIAVGLMATGATISYIATLTYTRRYRTAQTKLDAITALEVHDREFIDATELYRILGRPIPDPIDHAANLRARNPRP